MWYVVNIRIHIALSWDDTCYEVSKGATDIDVDNDNEKTRSVSVWFSIYTNAAVRLCFTSFAFR